MQEEARELDEAKTEHLHRISRLIDAFCTADSNFDADGTWSERGSLRLKNLVSQSVAELHDDGLDIYIRPRAQVLKSIGAIEEFCNADGVIKYGNLRNYTRAEVERAWRAAGHDEPWAMTDVFEKIKMGTPPHLSAQEVCGLIIGHMVAFPGKLRRRSWLRPEKITTTPGLRGPEPVLGWGLEKKPWTR